MSRRTIIVRYQRYHADLNDVLQELQADLSRWTGKDVSLVEASERAAKRLRRSLLKNRKKLWFEI